MVNKAEQPKHQTEINLLIETNNSDEIDDYVKSHIIYIQKSLIRKSLEELASSLEIQSDYSNSVNQIQFKPENKFESTNLKTYQILIEWSDSEELNIKSSYVKEHYISMNKFIATGDIKSAKTCLEILNE
jgi:hypothetical protein